MKDISIQSYGKVNLALDVLYKREDGYHEINSIFQQIDLSDNLYFKEIDNGIIIESSSKELPLDSSNLIYKAWEKIKEITGLDKGIHVKVEKNIPIAAGLAGGSSNAAATLKALNILWDLKLSQEKLMEIGTSLGADVPFCIMGGTAKAQGIGEKLTKIKSFKGKNVLLANPGIAISTAYAYSKVNLDNDRIDIDRIVDSIEKDDLESLARSMKNKMEEPVIREHPIIGEIKEFMIKNGALGALMSGSGSTVFGLYDDMDKLIFTQKKLKEKINKVYNCITI